MGHRTKSPLGVIQFDHFIINFSQLKSLLVPQSAKSHLFQFLNISFKVWNSTQKSTNIGFLLLIRELLGTKWKLTKWAWISNGGALCFVSSSANGKGLAGNTEKKWVDNWGILNSSVPDRWCEMRRRGGGQKLQKKSDEFWKYFNNPRGHSGASIRLG